MNPLAKCSGGARAAKGRALRAAPASLLACLQFHLMIEVRSKPGDVLATAWSPHRCGRYAVTGKLEPRQADMAGACHSYAVSRIDGRHKVSTFTSSPPSAFAVHSSLAEN
jgi:hypothetical protein